MNPLGNVLIVFAAVYVGKMADAQSKIMQGVIAKQNAFHAQHRQNEQGLLAQQVQNQNNLIRDRRGLGSSSGQQNSASQQQPSPATQRTNSQRAPTTSNVNPNQPNSQTRASNTGGLVQYQPGSFAPKSMIDNGTFKRKM
jgi:hypothetical protein